MITTASLLAFIIGFLAGAALLWLLRLRQGASARAIAREILQETESKHSDEQAALLTQVKTSFGALSLEALAKSTEEFLKLAQSRLAGERELVGRELDSKKGVIDEQLKRMGGELDKIGKLMNDLEKDRVEKFGQLAAQLKISGEQTVQLMQTTRTLREALTHGRARGQWGERMAEDILRAAGFVENVNYTRQKTIEGVGSRPDFTFLLPSARCLNMDVKFPLDNYLRFSETESESEKIKYKIDFLRDVKNRIREITGRDYINPQQNTLDYVLLFIPNEQVYGFIFEAESSLFDEGVKNKVILCSPMSLFAILAIIRQAMDNFALEQTSNEILALLGSFRANWE
ncbi:MAG: DNA recombination protein RmuC, partial [Chitinivibrionales bacterium]|nr:DNA recombination protein RmuC [Chitinivibrionales bacterium]